MVSVIAAVSVLVVASPAARADPAGELSARIGGWNERTLPRPRFGLIDDLVSEYPSSTWPTPSRADQLVVAAASSGRVAWAAAELALFTECVRLENNPGEIVGDPYVCPANPTLHGGGAYVPLGSLRATGIFERTRSGWRPVAYYLSTPISDRDQAQWIKDGALPEKIAPRVARAAAPVVRSFKATIGDPAKLAAAVSTRADVVLYGSGPKERYVGGAAARAQLARWKLALRVRDGINAGVTSSGEVAWVVANVDARAGRGKPVPYRLWVVYEKAGAGWQIVQLHFGYSHPR